MTTSYLPSDFVKQGTNCVLTACIKAFGLGGDPLLSFEQTLPLRNAVHAVTALVRKQRPEVAKSEEPIQDYSNNIMVTRDDKVRLLKQLGL